VDANRSMFVQSFSIVDPMTYEHIEVDQLRHDEFRDHSKEGYMAICSTLLSVLLVSPLCL
jgi:hypothetical protein